MKGIKVSNVLSKTTLLLISLATFLFTLFKLMDTTIPNGRGPLFFAGATKLLYGTLDYASENPFSVMISIISFTFKLDVVFSLKLAASLITALAPPLLFLNAKSLAHDELVGVFAAFGGVFCLINIVWAGDYHLIMGLVLFMYFTWLVGSYLKDERIRNLLPLIAISVLFLVCFMLASAIVVLLSLVFVYLLVARRKLSMDLPVLAIFLFFIGLSLYGINSEWLTLASMPMFNYQYISIFSEESWKVVPLALSFLGAVISTTYFFLKKQFDNLIIGLFLFCVGLCSVLTSPSLAILLILPLSLLSLKLLWQSYTTGKVSEKGEEVTVINIEGEKFFSALLSIIIFIALLNFGYYVATNSPKSYISNQDLSDLTNIIDWVKVNPNITGLIAAPTYLTPLLEGFLGSRILGLGDQQTALISDAVNETCFRIVTPQLLIDEFEPLSPSRAPIILAYDGNQYVPLLYVDDSYARVKCSDSKVFYESPYGATFLNYSISRNESFLELSTQFVTSNLIIKKTIRASILEPIITLSYQATNRTTVKVDSFSLPLWVAWGKGIMSNITSGSKVFLVLGNPNGQYSLEVDFQNATKDPKVSQGFIEAVFQSKENSIRAEVTIKINSYGLSKVKPDIFSVFSLPQIHDIRYILVSNSSPASSGAVERDYEMLYVDDAFVRFSFMYDKAMYTEAPAYANVTNEVFSNGNTSRNITYKTTGLTIQKSLAYTNNTLTLLYHVEAANCSDPKFQGLNYSEIKIWIPWQRELFSYNKTETTTMLDFQLAKLNMTFNGNLSEIKIGPDEVYGQQRIFLRFNLNSSSSVVYNETIGVSITCEAKPSKVDYIETTRPNMNGSDIAKFYVKLKTFEKLYSSGKYTLLEVLKS